jgi:hypothetical protein
MYIPFDEFIDFIYLFIGQGPIIANLHVTRERTRIFWPFFADDNNTWLQIRQQNLNLYLV